MEGGGLRKRKRSKSLVETDFSHRQMEVWLPPSSLRWPAGGRCWGSLLSRSYSSIKPEGRGNNDFQVNGSEYCHPSERETSISQWMMLEDQWRLISGLHITPRPSLSSGSCWPATHFQRWLNAPSQRVIPRRIVCRHKKQMWGRRTRRLWRK